MTDATEDEPQPKRLLLPELSVGDKQWLRLTPDLVEENPAILEAIEDFEAIQAPEAREAGEAAANWLRNRALADFRSTVTWLLLIDGVLEGFHSLAAGQVELRTSHRKSLGGETPTQPATLVTWLAKREGARVSGWDILSNAIGTMSKATDFVASVAVVLDPYDEAAARVWQAPPYGFRTSLTVGPNGTRRLWRSLLT